MNSTDLMHDTILRLSSAVDAASKHRCTAQLPKLTERNQNNNVKSLLVLPVGHHFKATSAYSVNNFASFFDIGNLELLLKKNRRLLVGGLYNTRNEDRIRWRGRRMEQRQKVDRL